MTIGSMKTPKTREEFEYGFHLLKNSLENGRMYFSTQAMVGIEGLQKVRELPNGRIDFLSVDELTRLQANMYATMLNNKKIYMPNQDTDETDES